jgi:hypothetical protein
LTDFRQAVRFCRKRQGKGVELAESQNVVLRIPPSGFAELAGVADHSADLGKFISALNECQNLADADASIEFLKEKTGLPISTARSIQSGLAALIGLKARLGLPSDQLLDAVNRSIESQAPTEWKQLHWKAWKESQAAILSALDSIPAESPLAIQQTVRELTYAHQHVLVDADLITDLRPVYNASATEIQAIVLTYVLSIMYQDGRSGRRIEFALDAGDVAKLADLAKGAQAQTATAKAAATEGRKWTLIVAGSSKISE